MLGPLYHLTDGADRLAALAEAREAGFTLAGLLAVEGPGASPHLLAAGQR